MSDGLFRVYSEAEAALGREGYPLEWDAIGSGVGLKHIVRVCAGDRCQRCGHPYQSGMGEWSPCDEGCHHGGPARINGVVQTVGQDEDYISGDGLRWHFENGDLIDARWRVLTTHHLNEVKRDCRWWNLVALCQRCHLNVQRRVKMDRPWPWAHSTWFRPYAAGFYAWHFGGEDLSREEVESRMEDLLALGARESAIERMPL